ncbi:DUF3515 domain-containing protein [Mycobacterium sp. M1]|uniref:DUF3515 domain-containing protein n=1 Tax=Mycolicibacter acidiphilus TaxID=2835306 RepID=A0ABS5RKX3_9MYCO|nr:DUF3515 domain-containing protein [Mycolicibacter acidiphilus]MBS9534249.1 DUF3515 domain-containing protein [Mycolicibacter acidiphilus]
MTEPETAPESGSDGPSRAVLIAALVFAVAAVGTAVAFAAAHRPARQPVALAAVPAPHADDPACHALLSALPPRLGDYQRSALLPPAPDGAAAWTGDGEPVVLRCGLDRPADFVVGSPIQVVDQVQWFAVREADRATWFAVDRPVYIALTLPPGSGPTPIQELSALVATTMPAAAIKPGPPH